MNYTQTDKMRGRKIFFLKKRMVIVSKKRKDNRYEAKITVGRENGKPKRITIYARTQKELGEQKAKILLELKNNSFVEPNKITVKQWLERWLHEYKKIKLRKSTWENYKILCNTHIIPCIGSIPLQKLTKGYFAVVLKMVNAVNIL